MHDNFKVHELKFTIYIPTVPTYLRVKTSSIIEKVRRNVLKKFIESISKKSAFH